MQHQLVGLALGAAAGYLTRLLIVASPGTEPAPAGARVPRAGPAPGLLELTSACLYPLLTLTTSPLPTPALWWLATTAIVLAWTDTATHQLPDKLVGPSLAGLLALLAAHTTDTEPLERALLAAAVLACCYLLIALLTGALGLGDAKAAAIIGTALGWDSWATVFTATLLSTALAGGYGTYLLLTHRADNRHDRIPFGPFMFAGALIVAYMSGGPPVWWTP